MSRRAFVSVALALCLVATTGTAALPVQNRIDTVTPAAPELAAYGTHAIGVRTMRAMETNRADILNTKAGGPVVRSDRTLTFEVWYPATPPAATSPVGEYRGVITRDPSVVVTLYGRAARDAPPLRSGAPFPLVIISHGYPGNRYLMSHVGENLASKGFVVVAIDHKDSTYDDQQAFSSTLYNRPLDQLFILDELARLGRANSGSVFAGLVDVSRTGLVGYSMGGYGVVNVIGGGFSKASETLPGAPPNTLLAERGAANPAYRAGIDARIKAAVAIAPWGMPAGFWDADGLKGITTPVLLVAGSVDDVAGYEQGARAIYQGAVNTDRYLLTFLNAGHNAAAPIPAPIEAYSGGRSAAAFAHYADAVWDTSRMNNILDHFATAFFELHLKGAQDRRAYLDLVPNGKDAVFAVDRNGTPTAAHTYWKGFKRGTAVGLVFEHLRPAGR